MTEARAVLDAALSERDWRPRDWDTITRIVR